MDTNDTPQYFCCHTPCPLNLKSFENKSCSSVLADFKGFFVTFEVLIDHYFPVVHFYMVYQCMQVYMGKQERP